MTLVTIICHCRMLTKFTLTNKETVSEDIHHCAQTSIWIYEAAENSKQSSCYGQSRCLILKTQFVSGKYCYAISSYIGGLYISSRCFIWCSKNFCDKIYARQDNTMSKKENIAQGPGL
jgi:hypothetical protein